MPKFKPGAWNRKIDVRDFIQKNYTPYDGDQSFLAVATERTKHLWGEILLLIKEEKSKGILDLDVSTPSSVLSHPAGYINQKLELILGLQTDKALKRAIKPNGGIKLVNNAARAYGYTIPETVNEIFTKYRKTHNDAVFDVYTDEIKLLRSKHVLTGLPDNYGRGRIIGDYRRVPLYGTTRLVSDRREYLALLSSQMCEENIALREQIAMQINALEELREMASMYGYDISKPAGSFLEAVQWLYFAYLGAIKEQDGAAMSLGRIDAFLDIYAEHDLRLEILNESEVQEIIDDFVMKLRIVRHLRHPEYDQLFAGDPTWVTAVLGGTGLDGRSMVTKSAFRLLHTLTNLGPAPEPNLTVLWGDQLPDTWKSYCAEQSIRSSSIQYENDDLMKPYYGDDYGIACCVSAMSIGKDMQLFGARANLAKLLLLTINAGLEEPIITEDGTQTQGGDLVIPDLSPLDSRDQLSFDEVWPRYLKLFDWLAERYVATMNIIHFMHDKYHYESVEMALHDPEVRRFMAFGIAGLSVVVDSLCAIKYANVKPIWNEKGVAEQYRVVGEYPKYGNDDDRADQIAVDIVGHFIGCLKKYPAYRDAIHTLSVLTITSNVVYGKATGETPDGRKIAEAFAPGANPMHGRDSSGAISSLNSVAKIPYDLCRDGISNTFSIVPHSLGKELAQQKQNLVQLLNGYFVGKSGHHLNINVLNREMLLDAQQHPEKYPQLTVRVSGYAVNFTVLSKEHQDEVIARTFHMNL